MGTRLRACAAVLGLVLLQVAHPSLADATCEAWAARLESVQGLVEHRTRGQAVWSRANPDTRLCPGGALRTGANSRATVRLQNETLVRLDQRTTINFPPAEARAQNILLELIQGMGYLFSRTPAALKFKTPFINAAIEGTEFLLSAAPLESRVLVLEGRVHASNTAGELGVASGEGAAAGPGQAPRRILVADPDDAVKWALHYPPVVYSGTGEPDLPAGAREAIDAFEHGDVVGALSALERVPAKARTAGFHVRRASIRLYVGRVREARADIARALALDPEEGTALALKSIIALALNDADGALKFAQEGAGRQGPQGAASAIALSYVYQSRFDLDRALTSARTATEFHGDNPLAWARLAELKLAVGDLDGALGAARKSTALSLRIARTQTTLGFAHLVRFEADEAAAAFRRAIELDQADPLPRLGLGISRIRRGRLAMGRGEIEVAASLGARSSIVRSYLGKAYFDERRGGRAGTEYRLAREFDPKDPTAWFYDAIRKQTENRPVEALRNLERSIELNDNRAVYRSSLLLDSDLAARGASQARIFSDLGFERRALVEGWMSVNADPGNWSAHRLLADSYSRRPRQDVARVSELFQSLMYQPINSLPLQPQAQESSLPVLARSGPTDVALNEFHPLFERDGLNLLLDGTLGNNDTWGDNLVLYGQYGRFSGSLGQFHYESDGFRENNGQKDDIYNAFLQVAVNPSLSLQAEYRHRESGQGDLSLNFDPDDFSRTLTRSVDQDMGRLGARFEITPSSELLLSVIAADRHEITSNRDETISDAVFIFPVRIIKDTDAVQGEAQYIFRVRDLNIIAGGAFYDVSADLALNLDLTTLLREPCPAFSPIPCEGRLNLDSELGTAYLYANIRTPGGFLWTLGLSYDDLEFKNLGFALNKTNPKVGVQWELSDALRVRGAYFKTLKPALVVEQTLQPTQIAGFTQLFDDGEAAESEVFGLGIDVGLSEEVFIGLEGMHRRVEVPSFWPLTGAVNSLLRDEELFQGYAYWTPTDRWALSAQFEYEDISRDGIGPGPGTVRTRSLPLRARYFHPKGFFGGFTGTHVDQTVRDTPFGFDQEEDSFWVLDLELGYRLPKRRGILSLEIRNLLDQEFMYQDHNYLVTEPIPSRFFPDRTIVGKISLSLDALFN